MKGSIQENGLGCYELLSVPDLRSRCVPDLSQFKTSSASGCKLHESYRVDLQINLSRQPSNSLPQSCIVPDLAGPQKALVQSQFGSAGPQKTIDWTAIASLVCSCHSSSNSLDADSDLLNDSSTCSNVYHRTLCKVPPPPPFLLLPPSLITK